MRLVRIKLGERTSEEWIAIRGWVGWVIVHLMKTRSFLVSQHDLLQNLNLRSGEAAM